MKEWLSDIFIDIVEFFRFYGAAILGGIVGSCITVLVWWYFLK